MFIKGTSLLSPLRLLSRHLRTTPAISSDKKEKSDEEYERLERRLAELEAEEERTEKGITDGGKPKQQKDAPDEDEVFSICLRAAFYSDNA